MKTIAGRRRAALGRIKYCSDLKFDRPLLLAFRRGNVAVKKRRAKYFIYEKKIFFMDSQRCAVATRFHIVGTN
jgi:hypothetical protein